MCPRILIALRLNVTVTKNTTIMGPLAEIKMGHLTSFESINLQKVTTVTFMD